MPLQAWAAVGVAAPPMIRLANQYAMMATRGYGALDLQRIEDSSEGPVSIIVEDCPEECGLCRFACLRSVRVIDFRRDHGVAGSFSK